MRRDLRLLALCALLSLPLTWSATFAAETRTETVNQALASLLLGTLPLLGTMLLWSERFEQDRVEVRYGKSRRNFAARSLLGVAGLLLLFTTVSATFAITIYRGPKDPVLMRDLLATLPIAVAGSLAVASFLAFFRSLLGSAGLVLALVLIWVVGSLDLPIAAAVPTGHIRYLIGVGAELPFAPWISFACLYGMTFLTGGAAL
jgi:hypothetical protein